jgi:tetratricopeptide (TPR) repeat protein
MARLTAILSLLLLAAPTGAAADWLSLKSEHFLVIGDTGARQLQTIALELEQFREVVSQLNPALLNGGEAPPVVVLVFRDDRAYEPFLPRDNGRPIRAGGFFQSGLDVNYITLSLQAGDRAYPAILHEFSHLLLRNWMPDAPLWFNEGIAEYYSTFEVSADGRRANIGKPIAAHRNLLQSRRLPFTRFFAVEHDSPEYTRNTADREAFYAQSWAIVHHAFHSDADRRDQLLAFVTKLAAGDATVSSFRDAYGGIELRELEHQVQAYASRPAFGFSIVELPESVVTRIEPTPTLLSRAEVDAWLGDLLAHMGRGDEAIPHLDRALAAAPELALAHSSLGTLRMDEGKTVEAISHFERAVAAGTENDRVHFLYAYALLGEGGLSDPERRRTAVRLLKRALELRPAYREARLLLADAYLSGGDHAAIRDLLPPLLRSEPANHRAALQLGESLLRLDDLDGARSLLVPVVARATEERDRARARTLLAQAEGLHLRRETRLAAGITARAAARPNITLPDLRAVADDEQRVYGVFESIECDADVLIIVVRTVKTVVRVRFASFADVDFVRHGTDLGREMRCGAQGPAEVYLTWRRAAAAGDGTAGIAVALEFLPDGFIPVP